jgi:ComF family protein
MRDAIHALKYDRLYPAARPLGRMLAQAIAQLGHPAPDQPAAPREMLVIPVPLHRSRHAQRGFNQARLLARQALRVLRKTHPGWRLTLAPGTLMRLRATESQAGLTPHQRRLNLRGAFSVSNPAAVAGRHVLVVDDIMTTGATARAAAQALLRANAASVWVATLSRARLANISGRGAAFGTGPSFEDAQDLNLQADGAPFAQMQGARSYPQDPSEGQLSFNERK